MESSWRESQNAVKYFTGAAVTRTARLPYGISLSLLNALYAKPGSLLRNQQKKKAVLLSVFQKIVGIKNVTMKRMRMDPPSTAPITILMFLFFSL